MENERFEFRLSAGRRRELAELAAETGISSADLARLDQAVFGAPGPGVLVGEGRVAFNEVRSHDLWRAPICRRLYPKGYSPAIDTRS